MLRRFGHRLCAKSTNVAVGATTAQATIKSSEPTASSSVPPISQRKPRTFEASEEEPAATTAHNAADFPPPPQQPYPTSSPLPNDDDPKLSAAAKRKIEIVNAIGDEAFEENTKVLKSIAMRGLRSGLIIVIGVVAFAVSLRKKKQRDAAFEEEEKAKISNDPTQRYLDEMSGLGFDTEQGEKDAAEARKKVEQQRNMLTSKSK